MGLTYGSWVCAQGKYTISGQMRDAATGEDLLYASVVVIENTKGCITKNMAFILFHYQKEIYLKI